VVYAALCSVVCLFLDVKPYKVVNKGEEQAEDEHSKRPALYLVCVVKHVDGSCAYGQVEEVGPKEEYHYRQYSLNEEDKLCKSEPRDIVET
jgi:hypothetical protein